MSAKEVAELRKSGKLEEALQKGNELLVADATNIWNKRAIAWVYYDYLKRYVKENNFELFVECLNKIQKINMPKEEKMFFDNCAWQIGLIIFSLKDKNIDYDKVKNTLEIIKSFHFIKPSESYSFLFKSFHKILKDYFIYLDFMDWWGFNNFEEKDYKKQEYKGKHTMSIVEQAYIAYSKQLLKGNEINNEFHIENLTESKTINKQKIKSFLPKLDTLINKYPEYQYPLYFKVKLLLVLESKENILFSFLPFARKKQNNFWIWELLSEIVKDDFNLQFACYCKALSLKTKEDYLVKLRTDFAKILIEKQMYNEAKTEIETVIKTRNKHKWRIPLLLKQWQEQNWYQLAVTKKNNQELYSTHKKNAESILFQDIEEEIIVVKFVNKEKNIINFIKNKEKMGFFKYSGLIEKPKLGDIFYARLKCVGNDNFYKALTLKKAEENTQTEVIKQIEGEISIHSRGFGFVYDVFVDKGIIIKNRIKNNDFVKGKAVLSFDEKKRKWGWKLIKIQN